MTRSVRSRKVRTVLTGLVAAVLLPAGLTATTSAAAPQTTPPIAPKTAAPQQAVRAPAVTTTNVESGGPAGDIALHPYMGWSSYSMQVYDGAGNWISADQLIKQSDAMHK